MSLRSSTTSIFLLLLAVLEMGLFTFWRNQYDPHTLPYLFTGLQLCVGIFPLIFLVKYHKIINFSPKTFDSQTKNGAHWQWIPLSILTTLGIYFSFKIVMDSIGSLPVKPQYSDVIPQVQVLCRRALAGEFPYKPITEFGYTMTANYLPTQWIPYLPAEIFKFDPRYISLGIFILSYGIFSLKIIKSAVHIAFKVALLALPVVLISSIHDHDNEILVVTVELLIMSYYLILGVSLTSNSRLFQAIGVILCLMSRFSLLFWLPLFGFMLWTKDGLRPTLKFCAGIFLSCLALYGFFLIIDPNIFFKAQVYYDYVAADIWAQKNHPTPLWNGLGFALLFAEKGSDAVTAVASFKKIMLVVTPSVSLILGCFWWRFKDKMDFPLFAVCGLKISLTVFYALIHIPYSYLYVTPLVVSLIVLFRYFSVLSNQNIDLNKIKSETLNPISTPELMNIDSNKMKEETQSLPSNLELNTDLNKMKNETQNSSSTPRWIKFAVLLTAFGFFLLKFDLSALDFTNTNWIYRLSFDPGSEQIAFKNYRNTPWHFPIIGHLEGGDYPTVTGTGMTSMVAILAVPFKLLSPWLPNEFQYLGLWYLLCFLLQGWFGLRLIRNICAAYNIAPPQYSVFLATVFFIIAPVLLYRTGHIIMFCQFSIIAGLSIYFSKAPPNRKFVHSLWLCSLMAGVSPYMTVMAGSFVLASFAEMWWRGVINFRQILGYSVGLLAGVLTFFYLVGMTLTPFESGQIEGFGVYSSNLNTFYNPMSSRSFLPTLSLSNDGQYEGYGYLGLGFIALILLTIALTLREKRQKSLEINVEKPKLAPMIFMMLLFFIYSLSHKIGFNSHLIFEWRYAGLSAKIFDTLRNSGRFIWIPFYGIMALCFLAFFKLKLSPRLKTGILGTFLMLQILDTSDLFTLDKHIFDRCGQGDDCPYLKWRPIFREASRVITFPPYGWNFKVWTDFYPFCRAASEENKSITTGYFARRNALVTEKYTEKLFKDWANGDLAENDKAVYIGTKDKLWQFQKLISEGKLSAFEYDGYAVLVPPALKNTMAYMSKLPDCQPLSFELETVSNFMVKYSNSTIIISVCDEATNSLDSASRNAFAKVGALGFSKLAYRGSYIGIVQKGKTVFEAVNNEKMVEKAFKMGEILRGGNAVLNIQKNVSLTSAGQTFGNVSKITVDEKDYSTNKRGINFVVLNDNFEVVRTAYFDTYVENTHAIFSSKM